MRGGQPAQTKLRILLGAGLLGILAGSALDWLGICPVVKRIWTPSWVLFSGGWCLFMLAGFYAILDCVGTRAWAYPLIVIGANSIAAYLIAHLWANFIHDALLTHLGTEPFHRAGPAFDELLVGASVLSIDWLVLWWMYRRKLLLRI
jgi:predicted acyltransferase